MITIKELNNLLPINKHAIINGFKLIMRDGKVYSFDDLEDIQMNTAQTHITIKGYINENIIEWVFVIEQGYIDVKINIHVTKDFYPKYIQSLILDIAIKDEYKFYKGIDFNAGVSLASDCKDNFICKYICGIYNDCDNNGLTSIINIPSKFKAYHDIEKSDDMVKIKCTTEIPNHMKMNM